MPDLLSIKNLLAGGIDSFTEEFLLPPRSDRIQGLIYYIQKEWASHTPRNNTCGDDVSNFNPNSAFLKNAPYCISPLPNITLEPLAGLSAELKTIPRHEGKAIATTI